MALKGYLSKRQFFSSSKKDFSKEEFILLINGSDNSLQAYCYKNMLWDGEVDEIIISKEMASNWKTDLEQSVVNVLSSFDKKFLETLQVMIDKQLEKS